MNIYSKIAIFALISVFHLFNRYSVASDTEQLESLQWAYMGYYPWIWDASSLKWVYANQPTLTTRNLEGDSFSYNGAQLDITSTLYQRPLTFRLTNRFPDSEMTTDSIFRIYDTDPVTGTFSNGSDISLSCRISINEIDDEVFIYCLEWAELPQGQFPKTFSIHLNFTDKQSGEFLLLGLLNLSIGDIIKEFNGTFTLGYVDKIKYFGTN